MRFVSFIPLLRNIIQRDFLHHRPKRLYMVTHMVQYTKGRSQTHGNTDDPNFKQFPSNLFFICESKRVDLCRDEAISVALLSMSSCFHSEILQPCESIQKLFKTN